MKINVTQGIHGISFHKISNTFPLLNYVADNIRAWCPCSSDSDFRV
jgi:hypothetical protein